MSIKHDPARRFYYLDGLRGLAALTVTNHHFLCAFAPRATSELSGDPWLISDTPFAIFYNGFAVMLFFVLSGFVISNAAAKRHLPLAFNLLQRYARLAVPVMASTLFAYFLYSVFPGTRHALRAVLPSPWLSMVYQGDLPGLAFAFKSGLIQVFTGTYPQGNYSLFNNVLWSMKIELLGSCLLYVVYALHNPRFVRYAMVAVLVLASVFHRFEYAAFAVGSLLREAVICERLPRRLPWLAFAFAVVFGAMTEGYGERVFGTLQLAGITLSPDFQLGARHKLFHLLAASLMIYAILNLPSVQRLLSTGPSLFLGQISFGLYLVHVPLIYSVIAALYLLAPDGNAAWLCLVYACFLSAAIAIGYVFTLVVDRPVVRGIHVAQRLYARHRKPLVAATTV